MKKESSSTLTPEQYARLERLAALPDEAIDTSDIPEVRNWKGAKRGLFFVGASASDRMTVGVDAGIVDWFESHAPAGSDLESSINRVLSEHIAEQIKKAS